MSVGFIDLGIMGQPMALNMARASVDLLMWKRTPERSEAIRMQGVIIAVGDAPPLFLLDKTGEAQLVNYRVAGHFFVVDRLFGAAELRLGEKKQAIVRIVRGGSDCRSNRRGRHEGDRFRATASPED